MNSEQLVPLLMLFTIIAVLGLAVWQLMAFLSKRRNRIAAEHAFKGSDAPPIRRSGRPPRQARRGIRKGSSAWTQGARKRSRDRLSWTAVTGRPRRWVESRDRA
jgi:hypothetical protein